jgi:hypothetical protein
MVYQTGAERLGSLKPSDSQGLDVSSRPHIPALRPTTATGTEADFPDWVGIVLLCHKLCVAVGTSWERSHKSADEFSPDGGDRLGDVAFRADGRSREAGRHSTGGTLSRSGAGRALRGKTGSARRPGTRKPQCTA